MKSTYSLSRSDPTQGTRDLILSRVRSSRPRAGVEEAGVEAKDGHHLLLHVDAGLAAIRVAHSVQSEKEG